MVTRRGCLHIILVNSRHPRPSQTQASQLRTGGILLWVSVLCIARCLTVPCFYSLDSSFLSLPSKVAARKSEDIAIRHLQTKLPPDETTALAQGGKTMWTWMSSPELSSSVINKGYSTELVFLRVILQSKVVGKERSNGSFHYQDLPPACYNTTMLQSITCFSPSQAVQPTAHSHFWGLLLEIPKFHVSILVASKQSGVWAKAERIQG